MLINTILLVLGFIILIKGADIFVDGASGIADSFKMPKLLIGLTIVAFGTSAPEFAVSVKSLLIESGDIVLGNVIGSNILNILLILGACSTIHPLTVKNTTVKKELPITMLITIAFAILLSDRMIDKSMVNSFTRGDGIVILLFFLVFIYYLIAMARKNNNLKEYEKKKTPLSTAILYTIVGTISIIIGSHFVVTSAVELATTIGVSERVIALTIIAFGTSLPELVTSLTATKKGEYDIAIGNVVGSNIFNIGVVIGLPVTILGGISIISFSYIDLIVMIIASVLLFMFSFNDYKITKREGITFLLLFITYYSYVLLN
ncbi:MAG: calcium/sodium antiporter [Bacilli bacterium]|nr:calcium/sodium antiporter [Bacilli bacterium]